MGLNKIQMTVTFLLTLERKWAFAPKDGSNHMDVVRMCCAIKPMTAWHLNKTVTTCRERSGGQGNQVIEKYLFFYILTLHLSFQDT